MDNKRYRGNRWRLLPTAPFIWGVAVPLVAIDAAMEIYQRVCFPLYGIPLVKRSSYVKMDRYKLPYLSKWDKIFCWYCEYANGVFPYMAQIAAETEKFWCGIKHESGDPAFVEPPHHRGFMEYGDRAAYEKLCALQKAENGSGEGRAAA